MANTFTTARVEAFSDGVIAVIITIMVLELKVPGAGVNGFAGIRAIAPTLAVYALSYAFVGIYWINHHLLLHRVEQSTPRLLQSNLVWLFFLSLLPFLTAYVLEKHEDSFSVALYSVDLLITGFAFMLLRLAINAQQQAEGSLEKEDRAMQIKHWISIVVYSAGIPLAFFLPVVTLYLIAAVNSLWIAPDFGTRHLGEDPAQPRHPR